MNESPVFISLESLSIADLSMLSHVKQLEVLNNTMVSDLTNIPKDKKKALKAKLERMKGSNPEEPEWIREKHWPLLQALEK